MCVCSDPGEEPQFGVELRNEVGGGERFVAVVEGFASCLGVGKVVFREQVCASESVRCRKSDRFGEVEPCLH